MASAGTVTVDFAAETAKFTAEVKKVRGELSAIRKDMGTVSNAVRSTINTFKGFVGAAAVLASVRAVIRATAEAEASQALLNNALRAAGANVKTASAEFQAYASQLQRSTTFSDDAVMQVQTLLLSFQGLSGETVKRATATVLDLSTRLGVGLPEAAKRVGKALADPQKAIGALAESGIVFSAQQREQIQVLTSSGRTMEAQAIVLERLEQNFGGAADAARDTFGGAIAGLQNALGDLLEGKGGINAASESINNLTEVLQRPDIQNGFAAIISGLAKIIELASKAAAGLTILFTGKGGNESVDIDLEIESLTRSRNRLLLDASRDGDFVGESVKGMTAAIDAEIAKLRIRQREILGLGQEQLGATNIGGPKGRRGGQAEQGAGFVTGGSEAAQTSEQFVDVEQRLLRQIALFGQSGEAAKVAYEIEAGALASLTSQEQQRVIRLAEQLDALAVQKTAMEELAKARDAINAGAQQGSVDVIERILAEGEAVLEAEQGIELRRLEMRGETIEQEIAAERAAAEARLAMEQDLQAKVQSLRQGAVDAGIGLLQLLAQRSKTAAKALILVNKGVAIAQAVQNTAAAVTKALAIYGPTPAGFAAAASAKAIGVAQIGLIAATGALEISNVNAGRSASVVGPGTPNNPINTQDEDRTPGASQKRVTQVIIQGNVYGNQEFKDYLRDVLREESERDVVYFTANSRQAIELRGG